MKAFARKFRRTDILPVATALLLTVCGSGAAVGETHFLHFTDAMFDDSFDRPDITGLTLQFDRATGHYEIRLFARQDAPFQGDFRINVNLYNGRLGPDCRDSYFKDAANDYVSVVATPVLRLSGQAPQLMQWQEGDLVAAGVLGLGFPDCTTQFTTGVQAGDSLDLSAIGLVSRRTMPLSFGVTDPSGDQDLEAFDVRAVNVQFDPSTGFYEAQVAFQAETPALGQVGLVLNGFNPDLGTTACDPALASLFATASVAESSGVVDFAGSAATLRAWSAGDRVGLNSLPFGSPDCATQFGSNVRNVAVEGSPRDALGEGDRAATIVDEMAFFRDGFESGDLVAWSASGR